MGIGFVILVAALAAAPDQGGAATRVFNVRSFGARGDRKANDAKAIQAAIDACRKAGGGVVLVPPGDYITGPLRLATKVTLKLEAGSTLWASRDRRDYGDPPLRHLLNADDAEDVALIGGGAINGGATEDYGERWGVSKKPDFRVGLLLFTGCRRVSIRDVSFLYSDAWTVHLKRCEDVDIDRVTIKNNYRRLNSDGIDPNSCRRVRISNCTISAGDDCIVLKATEPYPCEDVVVTDCVLESAASALKLGTESHGDFRNVRFSKCKIRNTPTGIGLYSKDGGAMEKISFSEISIETCDPQNRTVTPIFVDIERRNPDSKVGRIKDIAFDDIEIRSGSGIIIQGMPESAIENLALRRIRFTVEKADDYAKRRKPIGGNRTTRDERDTCFIQLPSYLTAAHAKGVVLEDIAVHISDEAFKRFDRSAVALRSVEGAVLSRISRRPGEGAGKAPVVDE